MHGDGAPWGLSIMWTSVLIALIFVCLRLYVRWYIQRNMSLSDGFIIVAMVLMIYLQSANTRLYTWDQWAIRSASNQQKDVIRYPDRYVTILKIMWLAGIIFYTIIWSVKFAFILFYYKLIPKALPWLRFVLHITTVLTVGGYLVAIGFLFFSCLPLKRNWSLDTVDYCSTFSQPIPYFTTTGFHFLTDLLIYAIPFFLLPHLTKALPRRQCIGLAVVFALGGLCIIASVIRVIILGTKFVSQAAVNSTGAVESCTAIVVACCPPLKWLYFHRHDWKKFMSDSLVTGPSEEEVEEKEWGTVSLVSKVTNSSIIRTRTTRTDSLETNDSEAIRQARHDKGSANDSDDERREVMSPDGRYVITLPEGQATPLSPMPPAHHGRAY